MFAKEEPFSRLDTAFADFLVARCSIGGKRRFKLKTLLARLSQHHNQGHSCLRIDDTEATLLISSGLCHLGNDSSNTILPLILEHHRLYMQRYWCYENRLAAQVKRIARHNFTVDGLTRLTERYFNKITAENESQRAALEKAVEQSLCIITGGPGTGKTTTVCKILALLQELAEKPLLIALTAPTGKAAMRLQESVASNMVLLGCAENIRQHIPHSATTLHRLLGSKAPSPYFQHDSENPLAQDVIVVDEASMVDLALMSKLVDALKPKARLILLGDKDQLVSVESGSVLADLVAALPANTVELTHSYRFDTDIKQLADAINQQKSLAAWKLIYSAQENHTISFLAKAKLFDYIAEQRQSYADLVNKGAGFLEIFQEYNRFQILCANRHGQFGAEGICQIIERKVFRQEQGNSGANWYPGRAVMVTQNNSNLGLFNGDIGICLIDSPTENSLMLYFLKPDGSIKKYLPSRLPHCETAFALTVHKSQGSEFAEVLIVLPNDINQILSKELLYTAVTRAKKSIKIVTNEEIFKATIGRKIERHTGLALKLNEK